MQDNKNNSEESLFTQMFGQPSEQPKEQIKKEEPTQEVNQNPFADINNEQIPEPVQLVPEEIIELNSNISSTQEIAKENTRNVINEDVSLDNLNFTPEQQVTSFKKEISHNQSLGENPNRFYPEETSTPEQSLQDKQKNIKGNPSAGIILLLVLIGFVIYAAVDINNQKKTENELIEKQKETEVEETEKNEESAKKEEPVIQKQTLKFDETLEFDKGLTTISNELKQANPFLPTTKTGVIRCDSKSNIKSEYYTQKTSAYLYYEDLLLKKYIQVSELYFSNINDYQLFKKSFQEVSIKHQNQEGFRVKYSLDEANKKINAIYYFNLAYGNKVSDIKSKIYFQLYVDYNDKITSALGALLYAEDYVNKLECSSIITE